MFFSRILRTVLLFALFAVPAGAQDAAPACEQVLAATLRTLYAGLAQDRVLPAATATTPEAQMQELAMQLRVVTSQAVMIQQAAQRYQGDTARLLEQAKAFAKELDRLKPKDPAQTAALPAAKE